MLLLDAQDRAGAAPGRGRAPAAAPGLAWYRAEVDQAAGMLTEQLSLGITDAFARLRLMLTSTTFRWPRSPATS